MAIYFFMVLTETASNGSKYVPKSERFCNYKPLLHTSGVY